MAATPKNENENTYKNTYENTYENAHKHCFENQKEIQKSKLCGCCFCLSIFPKEEITEWTDWTPEAKIKNLTAICPRCFVDSVLGDASSLPLTKPFLTAMHKAWF